MEIEKTEEESSKSISKEASIFIYDLEKESEKENYLSIKSKIKKLTTNCSLIYCSICIIFWPIAPVRRSRLKIDTP